MALMGLSSVSSILSTRYLAARHQRRDHRHALIAEPQFRIGQGLDLRHDCFGCFPALTGGFDLWIRCFEFFNETRETDSWTARVMAIPLGQGTVLIFDRERKRQPREKEKKTTPKKKTQIMMTEYSCHDTTSEGIKTEN